MARDFNGLLRYRWLVYLLLIAVYFLVYFHRVSPAVMGPEFAREWSLGGAALGMMSSLYLFSYGAVQVPAGVLADFFGPKKLIVFSALAMAAGSLLSYLAPTFAMVAVGRALIGAGAGFTLVPLLKFLSYWFRKNEFATMLGLTVAIGNIGAIVASAPLMSLMLSVGWRNVFLYVFVISLAFAILNIRFVKDTPEEMGFPSIEHIEATSIKQTNLRMTIKVGALEWVHNHTFPILTVTWTLLYGTLMGFQGLWAGPFLFHVYEMSGDEVGNWLLIMAVGMVIGQVGAGYLSDKVFKGRRKIVILPGCILYVVNWALLLVVAGSQHLLLLRVLFFTMTISFSIASVPIVALTRDLSHRENFGTIYGITNMFIFIGGTLFQTLMGGILDRSGPVIENGVRVFPLQGYLWAFSFCAAAAALAAFLALFIKERRQQPGEFVLPHADSQAH